MKCAKLKRFYAHELNFLFYHRVTLMDPRMHVVGPHILRKIEKSLANSLSTQS